MQPLDFLLSAAGREWLLEEYERKERSTYDLAAERDTHPNRINRALRFHGIRRRTRAEAQRIALRKGRHPHPTLGKNHEPEVKERIGEGVRQARRQERNETE